MTVRIYIQKQASGYYNAWTGGNGTERSKNLLSGDRRTLNIDEARDRAAGRVRDLLPGQQPSFEYEVLPPAAAIVREKQG